MPLEHHRLRRNYSGGDSQTEPLEQLFNEQTSELRSDLISLEEQITHNDLFTEELELKHNQLDIRVEKLEQNGNGRSIDLPIIRRLPPPPEPVLEPVGRVRRLIQLTLAYCIATLNTPFAGAAIFSGVIALVQVSTFYSMTASILTVTAMLVGSKKLTRVPF